MAEMGLPSGTSRGACSGSLHKSDNKWYISTARHCFQHSWGTSWGISGQEKEESIEIYAAGHSIAGILLQGGDEQTAPKTSVRCSSKPGVKTSRSFGDVFWTPKGLFRGVDMIGVGGVSAADIDTGEEDIVFLNVSSCGDYLDYLERQKTIAPIDFKNPTDIEDGEELRCLTTDNSPSGNQEDRRERGVVAALPTVHEADFAQKDEQGYHQFRFTHIGKFEMEGNRLRFLNMVAVHGFSGGSLACRKAAGSHEEKWFQYGLAQSIRHPGVAVPDTQNDNHFWRTHDISSSGPFQSLFANSYFWWQQKIGETPQPSSQEMSSRFFKDNGWNMTSWAKRAKKLMRVHLKNGCKQQSCATRFKMIR